MQIKLEGKINEDTELPSIAESGDSQLDINMAGITQINSMGVRGWMNWVKGFSKYERVQLFELPQVVVEQVNMIHSFLPSNAEVMSFYVPFYSEETDEENVFLLVKEQHFPSGEVKLPELKDSAGNKMEPDIFTERYFGFLKKQ